VIKHPKSIPGRNTLRRLVKYKAASDGAMPGRPDRNLAFGKKRRAAYKARTMNMSKSLFALLSAAALTACSDTSNTAADATAVPWECIAAKVTIGTNAIDTVVRYNKVSGEAQLLNAAAFASKATGAQGNIIGWVPLGDLKNAVQELMQREQAAQQQMPAAAAAPTPEATPEAKKK
jgi:hypothetical protein